jgi:hypothetical protein
LEGSPDTGNQKYAVELDEDGLPRLPVFNLDHVAPNDARLMLKTYIEFTWGEYAYTSCVTGVHLPWQCAEYAVHQSVVHDEVTASVPWDLLDTAALRRNLLVNPESFSHVKSMDPMRMTPRDVYDILDLLLRGQTSGVRPLEFSIVDNFVSNANLQEVDISDLDPPTPPPKRTASPADTGIAVTEPHTNSPRETGVDSATAEIVSDQSVQFSAEHNISSDLHTAIGPDLQDSLSPLPAPAASPVVDLPFKSHTPSSESMIKVAIRNVARAGYLTIIPIKADQTPQQGINTTTNSESKKRTQKEIQVQQEEDSGQPKKRAKIAVPAREQSSRYESRSYFNSFSLLG